MDVDGLRLLFSRRSTNRLGFSYIRRLIFCVAGLANVRFWPKADIGYFISPAHEFMAILQVLF